MRLILEGLRREKRIFKPLNRLCDVDVSTRYILCPLIVAQLSYNAPYGYQPYFSTLIHQNSSDPLVEKLDLSNFSKHHRTTKKVTATTFRGPVWTEPKLVAERLDAGKWSAHRSTTFGVNSWRVSDRQSPCVKPVVARRWCESAF